MYRHAVSDDWISSFDLLFDLLCMVKNYDFKWAFPLDGAASRILCGINLVTVKVLNS